VRDVRDKHKQPFAHNLDAWVSEYKEWTQGRGGVRWTKTPNKKTPMGCPCHSGIEKRRTTWSRWSVAVLRELVGTLYLWTLASSWSFMGLSVARLEPIGSWLPSERSDVKFWYLTSSSWESWSPLMIWLEPGSIGVDWPSKNLWWIQTGFPGARQSIKKKKQTWRRLSKTKSHFLVPTIVCQLVPALAFERVYGIHYRRCIKLCVIMSDFPLITGSFAIARLHPRQASSDRLCTRRDNTKYPFYFFLIFFYSLYIHLQLSVLEVVNFVISLVLLAMLRWVLGIFRLSFNL